MRGYRDKKTPEGERFFRELEKLKKSQVRIGFKQGENIDERGTDMANIAMWNELGTSGMPSRPFMRDSVDDNAETIKKFMKAMIGKLTNGATAEEILKDIGVFQKGLVQHQIESGTFEPNEESTIKRKGSSKPLIHTGRMFQSVDYVITQKGG